NRYVWTEGTTTYFDGTVAVTTITLAGVGSHSLTLTVYSKDVDQITQSGTKTFNVSVNPLVEFIAGRQFSRTIGTDFSFDPPYGSFAGITYSPVTQTYFVTDNNGDAMFEINATGTLLRTINIAGMKNPAVATADAEGITWMHGNAFALALHDG